ncbi:MAG TPA: hypothetical protein PLR69_04345 [Candidatus Limiplasma sp.]|nr:hypothetical protein [Candidatus Limiplasma sp.]
MIVKLLSLIAGIYFPSLLNNLRRFSKYPSNPGCPMKHLLLPLALIKRRNPRQPLWEQKPRPIPWFFLRIPSILKTEPSTLVFIKATMTIRR